MELKLATFLLVCPLVFLAGFVDAIGGGGGLISLPAYLLAGVPVHFALATNKMSSASGTLISTVRICRSIKIRWKLAIPAAAVYGRSAVRPRENAVRAVRRDRGGRVSGYERRTGRDFPRPFEGRAQPVHGR